MAVGAAAAAVVARATSAVQLKRTRAAQLVLLGSGKDDLVDFAVSLQARMDDLHGAVDEVAAALSRVDRRVDGSVTNTSLVRYDAYEGAGGHQSASIALPRREPLRNRPQRDPGPRLRAHLRQGARPGPAQRRPLARGARAVEKAMAG